MFPVVINGDLWSVVGVTPGDTRLIDRTGHERLATTDPDKFIIYINKYITPPLLDKVVLHEIAHAITISYKLLSDIRAVVPDELWIPVEEWSAKLIENHSLEAANAAARVLGRPVCIRGLCSQQEVSWDTEL